MFAWLTPSAAPTPKSPKPRENILPPAPAEFVDEDADGVDDNLQGWLAVMRPSDVSKAKYAKWAVQEENKAVGDEMRDTTSSWVEQRKQQDEAILDKGRRSAKAAKTQREAAAKQLRQHREQQAAKGQDTRQAAAAARENFEKTELAERQQHVKNMKMLAEEQKQRLKQTKAEQAEAVHAAAKEQKEIEAERVRGFLVERERELEEKRQRIARIKEETKPEVASLSKIMFYLQRKEKADDVRASEEEWRHEKDATDLEWEIRAHARAASAKSAHEEILGGDGKRVHELRQRVVEATEEKLRRVAAAQAEKEKILEEKKRSAAELTASMYVDPEAAERVQSSTFESLANLSRAGEGSRASSNGGSPRGGGRQPWKFVGTNGWFSLPSWLGGSPQEVQV